MAFGYFEALIHYGDTDKFYFEQARLTSLHTLIERVGYDPMLYSDFTDQHYELLRDIRDALSNGLDAEALLLEKFNDEEVQNYAIQYMRVSIHGSSF